MSRVPILLCLLAPLLEARADNAAQKPATVLAIHGTRFAINGTPAFLLGFSYYGALGAPQDYIRQDLGDFQTNGFNWLRVWATWTSGEQDISALTDEGTAREPFYGKLRWLLAECDRRGLIVDVTLTRDRSRLSNLAAHKRAVGTLVNGLKAQRNWYLDLANEHDVGDGRHVPTAEIKALRETVRQLDPARLVTASFGGHDLTRENIREALVIAGLDFLCPHRPRDPESPAQTEAATKSIVHWMTDLGCMAPVLYQEPFRRGYTAWQPGARDFLEDLRGARAGGAAGWCFHNGAPRDASGQRPRRSFDLRQRRLMDQLDSQERQVVLEAGKLPGR